MSRILVAGMAATDIVFQLDTLPAEPSKYRARAVRLVGGGGAANAAVAIARLGGEPVLVSRLGSDPFAEMILRDLERDGVCRAHVSVAPRGRSPVSSVLVDGKGERQVVNFRGENLPEHPENMPATGEGLDAVLVDTRWPQAARAALVLAARHGLPGIVDAEPPLPEGLIERASHVAFSAAGLRAFARTEGLREALAYAARVLPGWVCVTDGANGAHVAGRDGIIHVPALAVETVDTLGAGDVWHGAFSLRLGEGADEIEAVRFANAAAALKCRGFGGRRAAPDRAATERFLQDGAWSLRAPETAGTGGE